jgi:hypothetical protein
VEYLVVNRHTQEVYALIETEDATKIREIWATRCGYENWEDFIADASIGEEDVKIYRAAGVSPPEDAIPPEICSITDCLGGSYFFVAVLYRTVYSIVISPDGHSRSTYDGNEGGFGFRKDAYRAWADIPPNIRKTVNVALQKLRE